MFPRRERRSVSRFHARFGVRTLIARAICSCTFPSTTAGRLVTTSAPCSVSRSRKVRAPFSSRFETKRRGDPQTVPASRDHPAAGLALIDGRLEELGIANFFYLLQERPSPQVYRRASGPSCKRHVRPAEGFPRLAHRRGAQFPVLLQNSSFGFGKTRLFHDLYLIRNATTSNGILAIFGFGIRDGLQLGIDKRPCMRKPASAGLSVSPSAVEKCLSELQVQLPVVDKY